MTLKSGTRDQIISMFNTMKQEVRSMIVNLIRITYFMRGSIQYVDLYDMTPIERREIVDFIETRLDEEKNNPHPVY